MKIDEMIDYALSIGVDEVEIFYENSITNNIEVYNQEVESLTSANSNGIGVRVFIDNSVGFAYTSAIEEKSIKNIINIAIDNAKICPMDIYNGLPNKEDYRELPEIYNKNYLNINVNDKIKFIINMELEAKNYNPNISKVISTSYADQITHIQLYNSNGFKGQFSSNYCFAGVYVAAEKNTEMQTGSGMTFGRHIDELNINYAVADACDSALYLLGGKPVKSQKAEIIFDKKVGTLFMYVLSSSLNAEAVQKKRSLFNDKLNTQVANNKITIIDDGTYLNGLATSPFDGEGVPSKKTNLIEKGILSSFLFDTYTAKKSNSVSTGNASRSYKSVPKLSTTNFYMDNGIETKESIIKTTKKGFYVMEVSGLVTGGANPITGDFSVGAIGRWIENGEFTTAVREVTIAGNIIQMLMGTTNVANDMEILPIVGSFGCPTFKVNELTISGE